MGFLQQKAFNNTWEEVLSSNGLRLQIHQHYCMMFDLVLSDPKNAPSNCFLNELRQIFPNPKDLPSNQKLWNKEHYQIPGKATLDAVDESLTSADYTTNAKETEDTDLYEFISQEEKEMLCDKHDSLDE